MKILRHLQSRTDSTSKLASTAFQAFWPLRDSHLTLKLNGATRQERSRKSEVIEDLKTLDNMDKVDDDKIYEIHLELGKLMRNGKHAASDCFERNDELAKLGGILRGKCERFAEQKTLTENLITEKRDFLVEQLEDNITARIKTGGFFDDKADLKRWLDVWYALVYAQFEDHYYENLAQLRLMDPGTR
ncbi:MAG: hypothetical protein MMC33_010813, partial [Icmadophila ericetorum]|nr:hypothetical protein [Icmadophila ericetorum]